jgi:hypothetical protein
VGPPTVRVEADTDDAPREGRPAGNSVHAADEHEPAHELQAGEPSLRRRRIAVESRKSAVTYRSGGANCERRLSLPPSPRRPSFRFSSPLIEPGVRISRTRLSDGFHVKACARAERTARAAASTPAWPSRRAPVGASGCFRELLGSRQSPSPRLVQAHPEPGLLSSPGITRVHRSYEPLRRLTNPSPDGAVARSP